MVEQQNIFSKVRFLDLTRLLPGGFCTQIWADLGAEVIKIEEVEQGDACRLVPPLVKGQSHYYMALNRNKKSMTLNLKQEKGKDIFFELARTADVVIENFRPGVMERLGLDYNRLKEVNPRLIYCAMSGYGQEGPYREKAAHDINFLAESGYLDTAIKCGGRLPPLFLGDMAGSMFAAFGIAIALLEREQTGQGKFIDLSLFDSLFSWMTLLAARSRALGRPLEADDLDYSGDSLCYNIYPTADHQFIALGIVEEKFWVNLCHDLDVEHLIPKQFVKRAQDPDAFAQLEQIFAAKTQQEWITWNKGRDLCFSPVRSLTDVLTAPYLASRNLTYLMQMPGVGEVLQLALPLQLAARHAGVVNPPPELGQHTGEILATIGLGEEQLKSLKIEKVI
ncbi:MAG: CoA transferase [Firmicutes bacterium]|nr:CoA transferase [Bacillota bacterium]